MGKGSKQRRKTSLDDVRRSSKPAERSVWVCVRGDLNAEHDRLVRELADVRASWSQESLADVSPATALAEQVEGLRSQMRENEFEFRFRQISPKAFSDLIAAHPARKEKNEPAWNADTFPPALLAACAVEPEMTAADVLSLIEAPEGEPTVLSSAQYTELVSAALAVNTESVSVPMPGLASMTLHASAQS